MKIELNGKTALVCGASQGIGAATAMALAQSGAKIILLARSEDKLIQIKDRLPGTGHTTVALDLSNYLQLEERLSQLGEISILVNNSGGPKAGPLIEAESESFLKAFNEHILAAQKITQLLLPGMKRAQYGRILNIISTSVKTPLINLGVSNTIRGAMANWAKSMANELGPYGITVNNVLPGYTMTQRLESLRKSSAEKNQTSEEQIEKQWKSSIPLGRFAKPEEVANVVAFLASPLASYVTGVNVPVDGGRTPSL